MTSSSTRPWWQTAVFYQIYPRSFADGNGDGIGDLWGALNKLDYLRDLGVTALWLSPHYPSPLFDCGYDVADYTAVAPEYGDLDLFRRFVDEAHRRDIRVVLDLVLNHTSDKHPWFLESAASRHNPKRDWYVWQPGRAAGEPPNNWAATFGGSAWTLDPRTDEYYYHFFFKEQPDLNWRNPAVKQAMFDAVRFWLNLGVDGYRIDAIGTVFEDPALPNHTSPYTLPELFRLGRQARTPTEEHAVSQHWHTLFQHQVDLPEVHALMRELRAVTDEFDDRVLIGETDNLAFHGNGDDELHMVFNFPLMRPKTLTPTWVRQNQQERLSALPANAWPCNTFGNHDSTRVWTHYADGAHDAAWARLTLALLLTLRGTPFLYNGEEIGMTDLRLDRLEDFRDMLGVWRYHVEQEVMGLTPTEAWERAVEMTRDRCRTPLQWANAPHGGFCPASVTPWLPIHPNYAAGVNVAEQQADPASLWNFYRTLLHLRRASPALHSGDYVELAPDAEGYLAFLRRTPEQTCLVALNFSDQPHTLTAPAFGALRVIFSSAAQQAAPEATTFTLAPFAVYIAEVITA